MKENRKKKQKPTGLYISSCAGLPGHWVFIGRSLFLGPPLVCCIGHQRPAMNPPKRQNTHTHTSICILLLLYPSYKKKWWAVKIGLKHLQGIYIWSLTFFTRISFMFALLFVSIFTHWQCMIQEVWLSNRFFINHTHFLASGPVLDMLADDEPLDRLFSIEVQI